MGENFSFVSVSKDCLVNIWDKNCNEIQNIEKAPLNKIDSVRTKKMKILLSFVY